MPIPIPMAIDLVFTNMAPNENSQTINEMKKNYKKSEEITTDIKTQGLDEYLEFDNTDDTNSTSAKVARAQYSAIYRINVDIKILTMSR